MCFIPLLSLVHSITLIYLCGRKRSFVLKKVITINTTFVTAVHVSFLHTFRGSTLRSKTKKNEINKKVYKQKLMYRKMFKFERSRNVKYIAKLFLLSSKTEIMWILIHFYYPVVDILSRLSTEFFVDQKIYPELSGSFT